MIPRPSDLTLALLILALFVAATIATARFGPTS